MTTRECLEYMRGKPYPRTYPSDALIPCEETSAPDLVCKHPLVSVCMTAYNHERYIARAIESIMRQDCPFEYELIIGEDASPDNTREICFEYQRRFPDRVRVLWSADNVNEANNTDRITARCRGKYIAFCEGDDYWTDPKKLAQQVALMEEYQAVMCVAGTEWHMPDGSVNRSLYADEPRLLSLNEITAAYFHTTTLVFDLETWKKCRRRYSEVVIWFDVMMEICMATMGRVCYLPAFVSVYNWTGEGMGGNENGKSRLLLAFLQYVQLAKSGPDSLRHKYRDLALKTIVEIAFIKRRELFTADERSRYLHALRDVNKSLGLMDGSLTMVLSCALVAVSYVWWRFYCGVVRIIRVATGERK